MNIDAKDFSYSWLLPSDPRDHLLFEDVKSGVLTTLSLGYGKYSVGPEIHLQRLTNEKQYLYIVSANAKTNDIIACSYVRHDGKRSATTVLPKYRSIGIGRTLVQKSLKLIPAQFSEVGISNVAHLKLLANCGFVPVKQKDEIIYLLGDLAYFILAWSLNTFGVSYIRASAEIPRLTHNFYLMKSIQ